MYRGAYTEEHIDQRKIEPEHQSFVTEQKKLQRNRIERSFHWCTVGGLLDSLSAYGKGRLPVETGCLKFSEGEVISSSQLRALVIVSSAMRFGS